MQAIEPVEQAWDKKKILIALFVASVLIGGAYETKVLVLDKNQHAVSKTINTPSKDIAGANTNKSQSEKKDEPATFSFSPANIQITAQQKLTDIKQQVANLKVEDIASSSPHVQKVINDLKSLESYPKDQAKQMCENLCKSL